MKKLALILAFSFLLLPLWAATTVTMPYIRQYPSSFTVDLASNKFLAHLVNSTWSDASDIAGKRNNGIYYKAQELGVIGLTGLRDSDNSYPLITHTNPKTGVVTELGHFQAHGDVTITVSITSDEWFYRLAGSEYKRPFGIDFFARGKPKSNMGDEDIPLYSFQMGNQISASGIAEGTVSKTIPSSTVVEYESIWWDVCLVLDPEVDTIDDTVTYSGIDYQLLPSDKSYTVDLTITLSCGNVSEDFPIHLEGFYKPSSVVTDATSVIASMTIDKLPGANELRLDNVGDVVGLLYKTTDTPVATYTLNTSTVETNSSESRVIYMFLSSSETGYSEGSYFMLRHVNDRYGTIYPLIYVAYMESTAAEGKAHAVGSSAKKVYFDGRDQFLSEGSSPLPDSLLMIEPIVTKQKQNAWYARWGDSGNIGIKLTGETIDPQTGSLKTMTQADKDSLPAGEYTSNIYVHIVTF